MSIQNLIDELRKQLPGMYFELKLNDDESGYLLVYEMNGEKHAGCGFGSQRDVKTPDEALAILRQRLGLEGNR